jgi:hypothetical protein
MEINLQGGIKLPQSLPGARSADLPVAKPKSTSDVKPARVPGQEKPAAVNTEVKREAAVYRAAESFFKDVYAVSDTTFTIFKDTSGQYITRYTSLRDGKVTYIPEPDMMAYLDRRMQAREALIEIQA